MDIVVTVEMLIFATLLLAGLLMRELCNSLDGKEAILASAYAKVSFRAVKTRNIFLHCTPRYSKKYIFKHGLIFYYKNPVKKRYG